MNKIAAQHNYTKAQLRFLEKNVSGCSYADLHERFNRHFRLSLTLSQIAGALNRNNLSNGLDTHFQSGHIAHNKGLKGIHYSRETEWKKGNKPWNYKPVGSERISRDGYFEVKVRNPGTWKYKHRIIWEKANGKVPKGHVVIFADGNKGNFDLDNLLLISRKELAVMNHCSLMYDNGDLTKTGKAIADIKILICKRKKEGKKRKRKSSTGSKTK